MCLIVLISLVFINPTHGSSPIEIKLKSPKEYATITDLFVILKVQITSNGLPVTDAKVRFHLDNNYLQNEYTDENGNAHIIYNLEVEGYHFWNVEVLSNYTETVSPNYSFYFDRQPRLSLSSPFGEVYGEGAYNEGTVVTFWVSPTIVEDSLKTRHVFKNWSSSDEDGYNGESSRASVTIRDEIEESAVWVTEYYVEFTSSGYGDAGSSSGWYEKGEVIMLQPQPGRGETFSSWIGIGSGSYSSSSSFGSIIVNGPIVQEAVFSLNTFDVEVSSEYGEASGYGSYEAGTRATIGVAPSVIQVNSKERYVFNGWTSDSPNGYQGSDNPFNLEIYDNLLQTAQWQKEYYVEITTETGGSISPSSGWYREGSNIEILGLSDTGYIFNQWEGTGSRSYTGSILSTTIRINSPITQKALFTKLFRVSIDTELSSEGEGWYPEGSFVTIRAQSSSGSFIKKIFNRWAGDLDSTNNPLSFVISKNTNLTPVYRQDYSLALIVGVVSIGGLGSAGYFVVKKLKAEQELRLIIAQEVNFFDDLSSKREIVEISSLAAKYGLDLVSVLSEIHYRIENGSLEGYISNNQQEYIPKITLLDHIKEKMTE